MSQSPPEPPTTSIGQRTEIIVNNILEPIDVIGRRLLGSLWKTFYESVQDAIALSLLLQIPSLIGKVIIGKEFSSYDVCLQENALGSSRYACFIIVTSDFLLWIVLAGRIISRFLLDFRTLFRR
ncbi:hypothetical protein PCC8801_1823 [Rippkaea orientalis PCC 8801]|uniref:Uncharacterized protein n=1 Tax=Rippkaea orientalis (strain PCC 8801 / RF-1) TaxID=41431 RepID=B7JX17_RIPO1|nr:hypothetical protein [Rippkaea orientalis]ACK65866.1 hypothetical protein PCC8801_1823 [Rippkaea orientalis PCC 8801]